MINIKRSLLVGMMILSAHSLKAMISLNHDTQGLRESLLAATSSVGGGAIEARQLWAKALDAALAPELIEKASHVLDMLSSAQITTGLVLMSGARDSYEYDKTQNVEGNIDKTPLSERTRKAYENCAHYLPAIIRAQALNLNTKYEVGAFRANLTLLVCGLKEAYEKLDLREELELWNAFAAKHFHTDPLPAADS
ncbi:MAG: hypothetical protein LBL99_03305 [Holosporaceae bacterium]|jgi:hypothetical protein|nr:hypothetical protein [Holosporaceae bacterium]